jgi:glycosyltransferase involved in cell wall biosynthesis
LLKKKIPFGLQIYYVLWQWGVYLKIRNITKKQKNRFDFCHHLTFGMTKMVPPSFLINIPFIWGPIGGGDMIPFSFLKTMGLKAWIGEGIYYLLHKSSNLSPIAFFTRRKAKAIIFRMKSAQNHFPQNGCQARFIISETAQPVHNPEEIKEKNYNQVNAVCIGRMIHGKGYIYALKGFHNYLVAGGKGTLVFLGNGPEEQKLKTYVNKYKLNSFVTFKGFVSHDEVIKELNKSNVLIHPSFREGGSWSIIEAMSYGLPVVCLNTSGSADMVTNDSGLLIEMNSPFQVAEDIGNGLLKLSEDVNSFRQLGINAQQRIIKEYNWNKRCLQMEDVYQHSLSHTKGREI